MTALALRAWPVLRLMAAGMLLSWCVSLRFPAETSLRAWLLPSADIAVLLALFALFAPNAPQTLPRAWLRGSCALLIAVRVARIAEGVCQRYFDRSFHLAADLPLLTELVRLGLSTLGPLKVTLAVALLGALLALTWWLARISLERWMRTLTRRRTGDGYLATAGALALLGPWLAPQGSFYASSVTPRMLGEVEGWLTARGWLEDPTRAAQRKLFAQRFVVGQEQLRKAAAHLAPGTAIDVHVMLVEAYGRTVQTTPIFAERLAPSYQAFAQEVAAAGFEVCTDFVRATVLGGSSWLTHATLQTGTPLSDQFDYGILLERSEVSSLAKAFKTAGYRTVSVKPGTTRASPATRMYGFDREYTAQDLDYHGRAYSWAPMPDQFVLQRVAERELRTVSQPLFIEYALVSSHFPFNPRPPYIDDWATLGDGSIFHKLPALDYDTAKYGLFAGALGYLDSLSYELRVLAAFLSQHVRDDALVLVLGDHQPIAPLAGDDRSRFTPLHVLSRKSALLEPFRARGCTPGMKGSSSEPQWTMEELGVDVLGALSSQVAAP